MLRIVLGRRFDMTHIQVSEGDDNGGEKAKQRILGYLQKGIQTPMAQGRSTNIISKMKWIRTSRLSMKNSLSSAPARGLRFKIFKRGGFRDLEEGWVSGRRAVSFSKGGEQGSFWYPKQGFASSGPCPG